MLACSVRCPRGQTSRSEEAVPKSAASPAGAKAGASSPSTRVSTKRRKRCARLDRIVETEVQRGDAVGIVENAEGDGVAEVRQHAVEVRRVDDDPRGTLRAALVEHAEEELELAGDAGGRGAGVGEAEAAQRVERPEQKHLRVEKAVRDVVLQPHEASAARQPRETPTC